MQVPVVDFESYDPRRSESVATLSKEVDFALSEIGFMSVTHLGIDSQLLSQVFKASHNFFLSNQSDKDAVAYQSASENFGYQGLCKEHLDPTRPADLKETFTMRNLLHNSLERSRWPSTEFRDLMTEFYRSCLDGAFVLQRVLANALGVEPEFFVHHHNGENVSLRLLFYPDTSPDAVQESQLGAGEHTDYGMLTLLFQDDVGGLQVRDSDDQWQDVDYIDSAIIVNSGDLLERWTNGHYRSTLHRVKPKVGHRKRFSIAMFVDPDSATPVSVLESCIRAGESVRYEPITAGEHIQERIRASHASLTYS